MHAGMRSAVALCRLVRPRVAVSAVCARAAAPQVPAMWHALHVAATPASIAPEVTEDGERYMRSPFSRDYRVHDTGVASIYSHLQHLCSGGRTPRAYWLHELLRVVKSPEDFDIAMNALSLCRTRFVDFTYETCSLVALAGVASGEVEKALAVFEDAAAYRMFVVANPLARLALAAAEDGRPELVQRCLTAIKPHTASKKAVHVMARALTLAGDLDSAIEYVQHARHQGVRPERGTFVKIAYAATDIATSLEQVDALEALMADMQQDGRAFHDEITAQVAAVREQVAAAVAASEAEAAAEAEVAAEDEADADAADEKEA